MKLFTRMEAKQEHQSSLDVIRAKEAQAAKALADKIQRINDLEAEYPPKLAAKQKELADIELQTRTLLHEKENSVLALEERRQQALEPIVEELKQLEKTRTEIEAFIVTLDDKQLEIQKSEERLRAKEAGIKVAEANLSSFQLQTEAFIAEQKRQAKELQASSRKAVEALERERELTNALIEKSELQRKSAERAERIAKAAMIAADKRIDLEHREQKKTDDKRNMLAVAVSTLKKKGLWHSQLETKIK